VTPPTLLNLPPGVLHEDMHPNSILTNPEVAKLLHSLSPRQIQHSLDEFCNEMRYEGGIGQNIIGDLVEFLKRETARLEKDPMLLRALEQVRISHRVIDSIRETARLEKDAIVLMAQENARDSKVQTQALEKELRESKVENKRLREQSRLQEDASNARVQSQALEKELMAYVTNSEEHSDSSSVTRSDLRQEEELQDSNSETNFITILCYV